ncbi:MAG TPA: MarR family winged helix-turn-helix transcriptional regulator [Herbaspirillum sp.]
MENSEKSLGPLACHCFAARQLARHVTKLYERHMAPAGITGTQLSMLGFLQEAGDIAIGDLAGKMGMDRTTLLRGLKPLQAAGLVLSGAASESGRQLRYSLSAAGVRKIKEAMPLWIAAQQEYEAEIGQQPARQLRQKLLTMTAQP